MPPTPPVRRPWPAPVLALCVAASLTAGAVWPAPGGAAPATPAQEEPGTAAGEASDRTLVAIDGDLSAGGRIEGELDALGDKVDEQLARLRDAEDAVAATVADLADADAKLSEIELRIEELTERRDQVVIRAFVSPPTPQALDVLAADTLADATVKNALLGMQADESAAVLDQLTEARQQLEERRDAQRAARADAEAARAEAEAALADLKSGVGQQVEFVLEVENGLGERSDELAARLADDPELAARVEKREAELAGYIDEVKQAREYQRALDAIAEAERRAALAGIWKCPVQGQVSFSDTWGAARSGGRSHQGTDMMASTGTPTVAPVAGRVEHRGTSLGGLSWYVYGDDGHTYYGTHLSGYANVGAGWVERGTVIGYVGDSGNAAGIPHLHFEYKPGGGASVNPYPRLIEVC